MKVVNKKSILSLSIVGMLVCASFALHMCSRGGGGGGGGEDDKLSILQKAEEYFHQQMQNGSSTAIQDTVNFLKSQSGVRDAKISPDGVDIDVTFLDGSTVGFLTVPKDSPYLVPLSSQGLSNRSLPSSIRKPVNIKPLLEPLLQLKPQAPASTQCVILAPFQQDFQEDLTTIKSNMIKAGCSNVDVFTGPIKIDTMRSLNKYGIIYISTHGGVIERFPDIGETQGNTQTYICSGEEVMVIGGKVMTMDGEVLDDPNIDVFYENGKYYAAYGANFFKNQTFPSSYIILSACFSGETAKDGSFREVFYSAGAEFVMGWNGIAPVEITKLADPMFFSKLAELGDPQLAWDAIAYDPNLVNIVINDQVTGDTITIDQFQQVLPVVCNDGFCDISGGELNSCPQDCSSNQCCIDTNGCPPETLFDCPGTCCCCPYGARCMTDGSSWICGG